MGFANTLLYSPSKAPLLPKSGPNELDKKVGTNSLDRNKTYAYANAPLDQASTSAALRGAVPFGRKRLPRTLSLVETLSVFGLRNVDDPGNLKLALREGMLKHLLLKPPSRGLCPRRTKGIQYHMHVLNFARDNGLDAVHVQLIRHHYSPKIYPRVQQLRRRAIYSVRHLY